MEKLKSYLELFLKQEVALLLQGDQAIGDYENKIPNLWKEVLLTEVSKQNVMEKLWQPFMSNLFDMPNVIKQITDIGLVISTSRKLPIGLLYIFKHTKSAELFSWLGYPPANPDQIERFKEKFCLSLPNSYQKFVTVHDGLLRDGWSSHGLKPLERLYWAEINQRKFKSEQRLVAFSGDGAGNEQCYDLSLPINLNDYLTVDLDHESHEIAMPQTFEKYFEILLKAEMGL